MLSLIVPALNEEEIIKESIEDMIDEFSKRKISYEIIVVNNGSTDRTKEILEKLAKKRKTLRILNLKERGFGLALIEGFKIAKGDYLGYNCADGQVPPSEIVRIYEFSLKYDYDVTKADRLTKYKKIYRRFISRIYNLIAKILFFMPVSDINGYPLIMKRNVYDTLNLKMKNFTIQVEIQHKAIINKFKIYEIPIVYQERKAGKDKVNLKVIWNMLYRLLYYRTKSLKI